MAHSGNVIALPKPVLKSTDGIEQLLKQRRSIREYTKRALSLTDISQLLWAAQGITHREGWRTAPSAGALYPLELYLVVGNVEGLDTGIYHYQPSGHQLIKISNVDVRQELAQAALSQDSVGEAAAVVVFTAVYARTTKKYGQRGRRYVHIEIGHAAENLFLQAESLKLGTVVVGAFDDQAVSTVLRTPPDHAPLLLMPIGHK